MEDFVDLKCKDDEGRDVFAYKGPSKDFGTAYLWHGDFVAFVDAKPVKTTLLMPIG